MSADAEKIQLLFDDDATFVSFWYSWVGSGLMLSVVAFLCSESTIMFV
jgi:hypothetical protein